ncbi:uncharacterized protein LOC144179941 [Haemaphysalis longicornis]
MILGTPPKKRKVIQRESPQSMSTASALEQNVVNDGPDSDEVTAKAYAPGVLQSSPGVARYVVDSMKKDNHKRELANLDAGGPPTEVEITTEVETQLLLKDKRADPSYMCGCDGSAYSAGPTAMTRKVHQLHPHEGTATKGKLLERSPCKTTDPSTIVHLPVGLRDDAKDRSPPSSGKRLDKKAAVGMGTPMIKKANRCVRKSEKPRECGTGKMPGATSNVVGRALVWTLCTAGFVYQASDVLQLYTRQAFTVTVYKEHGSLQIRFPAVTICTEKWSKKVVMCKRNNSYCHGAPEAMAEALLFDPELRAEAAYPPTELFKCHMHSQDEKCPEFPCESMIRRTFYRTPFFMCYTFDMYHYSDRDQVFRSCKVPWMYELELTAEWDPREVGRTDHVEKYPLIVHEAGICPPEKLAPIHLRPGTRYTVSIAQRSFRRLPYPSASRCVDYQARGRINGYFGYMNYEVCLQDCLVRRELGACGCVLPDHEFAASAFSRFTCPRKKRETCMKRISPHRERDNAECKIQCPQPCRELKYDVKLVGLADDQPGENRSSFTAIIRFATNSQTVYDYHKRLSGLEAFGYIGGYIGMWLGVSLYSIYVGLETSLGAFLRSQWQLFKHSNA